MNDETPTPFDTVGDAPIEARIVAWVLGEASAFEVAELERLCEERPELLVFRRRMRALHGLLTEAEAAETDDTWKLSPDKRKAIEEIFGGKKVVRPDVVKEKRISHSGRRAFLAIAACLILTFIVAGLFGTGGGSIQKARKLSDSRAPQKKVDFMPDRSAPSKDPALQELNKAVRDQEDKVEERRKVLSTIVRTKGIIYKGQDSFYGQSGVDEDQGARSARQSYNQLEQEKMQLESQLSSLEKYDDEQAMTYASGLNMPDNVVKNLLPQYAEAKRNLEKYRIDGLAEKHPTVVAQVDQIDAMKTQLDDGVVNLKATLQAQKQMTEERLRRVEAMKDDSREESIKRGLDAQDYVDAKHDFENDQQLLQALKLRQIELSVASAQEDKENAKPASPRLNARFGVESKQAGVSREAGMKKANEENMLFKRRLAEAPAEGFSLGASRVSVVEPDEAPALLTAVDSIPPVVGSGEAAGMGGGKSEGLDVVSSSSSTPSLSSTQKGESDEWSSMSSLSRFDAGAERRREVRPKPANAGGNDYIVTNPASLRGLSVIQGEETPAAGKRPDVATPPPVLAAKAAPAGKLVESQKKVELGDDLFAANQPELQELLSQVDSAWKLTLPATDASAPPDDQKIETLREFEFPTEYEPPAEEAQALVDLLSEIPASGNPYSTFSLNISDASFQLAKAALARGERPDPTSIKPEQFYNAVDYGDPAPASNQPVAATIEQSAHPVIPGRNLVRIALRTGSVGRSAIQPLHLTLLVDQSGSMVREDRRVAMEHALQQLGVLLTKNDLVTVIGFSRTPHLLADAMTGDQATKLGDLVNQTASEGGTNLEEALKLGGQLAIRHQLAGAQNRIVLFTDGAANLGDAKPARLAEQVKTFRQQGLAFDIAGIGADGLNDRLLSELARNGNGRYYVVGDEKNDSFARQLAGAFRPAAENVKVQVNFNPQRVGKYKLIGFEKDRLKTEDFRNDAVDAAELAAEEAGVAIYQVEPLADGAGEIGEVSVRFRDVSGNEMVERTWTIPYESQATAFDRATPSMQLAGLSLLAAEKLRGGPMGDAIDFKQLNDSISLVKQFYGNSHRVADMLQVIDALK